MPETDSVLIIDFYCLKLLPSGYNIMTEVILCAVHPVACYREVCDVLCLSAAAVTEDNACCACGYVADELSLAVIVCLCLCLGSSGPCAVKLISVIVPSVNIRLAPTEVIGQQEGALGIRIRVGTGDRPAGEDLAAWVLGHPAPEEKAKMEEAFDRAAESARIWAEEGIEKAMQRGNQ